MEKIPEISLIICTRNRDDLIVDVLSSAANQTLDSSQYEVLILDQSDNDKTQKLAENYPQFKYIKLDSRGASISRNEAITHSKGNILVYIDDDILFDANYLETISNFFKNSDLKPDMIGGKTLIKWLGEKPEWIDGPLLGILAHSDFGDKPAYYDSHPKHVPYTCNMAIKRECVEKAGGFSEFICDLVQKYPINEDVLFALKMKNYGFNLVYCPQMFVWHRMPAARFTYDYYRGKYYSHGLSDTHLYFILKMFNYNEIPAKIFIHAKRLIAGFILKFFKKNPPEKYYQKLRIYYNFGCIKALLSILSKKGKLNEDT